MTALASLQAERDTLLAQLADSRDNARELASMIDSFDGLSDGEHAAARKLAKAMGQVHTAQSQRDQWMTTAGALRKEVKELQRKLGMRR